MSLGERERSARPARHLAEESDGNMGEHPARARVLRAFLTTLLLSSAALAAPVVTITAPAANTTVSAPVQITASATDTSTVTLMQVYVDGAKKYEVKAASINIALSLSGGSHKLSVLAYDSTANAKATEYFTASTTSSAIPSSAITAVNIDQITGWNSCDVCAGAGGAGKTVTHSVTYGVTDPAMDGNSIQFHIGDSTAVWYGTTLFWQYVTADENASNFVYDLYFYVKTPSVMQALEFDVNQTRKTDSIKYIYGTECDIKMTHTWRVYDNYNKKWVTTGVACAVPTAYQWHHLSWEFQRTATGPLYVALTVDGVKNYVNMQVQSKPNTGSGSLLNVAVQLDGNSVTAPYDEWVDQMQLSHW
jgi:hypothetical protein